MSSVDVPVALLGYGTVGAAVSRLLEDNADDIERATGHRLRVVRALVRDLEKERDFAAAPGVLTTRFEDVLEDDSIAVVAEVMGGLEPTGEYVLSLLRSGKPVVSANKQLIARRGAELFHTVGNSSRLTLPSAFLSSFARSSLNGGIGTSSNESVAIVKAFT